MEPKSIELPLLPVWLLRLVNAELAQRKFVNNPLLFALWYSLAHDLLTWPEAVQGIQKQERSKKLSFDRAMALLNKVKLSLQHSNDVDYARLLLEGYAVHAWVADEHEQFFALCAEKAERFNNCLPEFERVTAGDSAFAKKLQEFCSALKLSFLEKEMLQLAVACAVSGDIRSLFEQLSKDEKGRIAEMWARVLDCPLRDLAGVLSADSTLRTCGLLSTDDRALTPRLSNIWISLLTDANESLLDGLVEPLRSQPGAGMPARLPEEDKSLAISLLQNAKGSGVNLLLYGAQGLEKRVLLEEILRGAQKKGFRLRDFSRSWGDYPAIAYVAQRALLAREGTDAVLVIERPSDVLERRPSEIMRMMFGIEVDSGHIAPFDELMLSSNPAPSVWTGADAKVLSEECIARFVFHAHLQKATRSERRAQLEALIKEFKLSAKTEAELLKLEDVSALQLESARRAARLLGVKSKKDREAALVQAVKRSLKALSRGTAPKEKSCVTEYSLEYLNCAGRFGPAQVLKALKHRPKGSLCLYGPPGTGKTQYVEYLAKELGKPLMIKRASDLLSKWVGENEQNIAKMFAEAESEEAVLFLDEGDSFLRDRSMAQQGWEVTQVNELLQHMERFEGIFILATNLFKGLDAAALRRFTFKIEFMPLNEQQRWAMFVNEAGLQGTLPTLEAEVKERWQEDLLFLPQLTAGDFATVKRQCELLNETLTPEEWLEQLKLECAVKVKA